MEIVGNEIKKDVTFEGEIEELLNGKNELVKQQLNAKGLKPGKLGKYDYAYASDDQKCLDIYEALKGKRFDSDNDDKKLSTEPKNNLVNESNKFATWIYEGRQEKPLSGKKPSLSPRTADNSLRYKDIRPLFTDCDDLNMYSLMDGDYEKQIKLQVNADTGVTKYPDLIPKVDPNEVKDFFNKFKDRTPAILNKVKTRTMPKDGNSWTDDQINMFSAWVYDGKRGDDKGGDGGFPSKNPDDGKNVVSYMEPSFPVLNCTTESSLKRLVESKDKEPPTDPNYDLNFNDHIVKMFGLGHRYAMFKIIQEKQKNSEDPKPNPPLHLDLHDYKDVNNKKVEILDHLTRADGASGLMPRRNPWPKKNILLFYLWALQGDDSKETSNSSKPKWTNEANKKQLVEYCKRYYGYLDEKKRLPVYTFFGNGNPEGKTSSA
ncbi:hypothetical protein C2G38_2034529 [Gigaspora rosea]|uniref:Uncharacterized protein n=1 Tax=Gigaspora rosea TaxID=44941 RepID=A0A397VJT3_9GLOM|nr:hypothetical protein C2G38_2034529 [Gigaspora rosea]CAG8773619.1 2352_t:CDS:1 [Gigaspora rosea]